MADTQIKGLPKTVYLVFWNTYVHNGHFTKHIKAKHTGELLDILQNKSKEAGEWPDQVKLNNCMEVDEIYEMDIDDKLLASTPIPIDKREYHTNGLQPIEDNVDINASSQCKYSNPFTPFLDEHELERAFWLVNYRIIKKAIDDLMTVHTVKSNLPKGHLKSAHTFGKKLWAVEPDGIGKHWISSKIHYNAANSETCYFWRDLMKIVKDLLQNPSYRDNPVYTSCMLTGKFGGRI